MKPTQFRKYIEKILCNDPPITKTEFLKLYKEIAGFISGIN